MIWPTDILSLETWILLATLLGLFRYYVYRKWSVLKNLNIPHDPPSLLNLGNVMDGFVRKPFTYHLECKKKYGPIYGVYSGATPVITIHDVEILKQIFIKDFSNFPCREVRPTKISGRELNNALTATNGPQWKRMRQTMSPLFSSAKLRPMVELMEWCVGNTVELLNKKQETTGGTFNVRGLFSRLSLDVVLTSAFSTKVHSQDDSKEEPEISKQAKELFKFSLFSPIILIALMFPPIVRLMEKMEVTNLKRAPLKYFTRLTEAIMQRKIEDPHKKTTVDLMQLMMEHQISEEDVKKGAEKGMTKLEITGNSLLMILAGYENTANTMTFFAYNMAVHPEIQTQVQKEIDDMMKTHGRFDYDGINELKLLDMCFNETLRLYMPILMNSRGSLDEITINGFKIPPKILVAIPVYALAHDPEYWDEPYEFKPERMRDMNQIDPMVFQPFGAGPRNCIGMRFAIMEVK